MARRKKEEGPSPSGTTITWLGGDDEPSANAWNGYTFKAGEPVEIAPDHAAYMVAKAMNNPFYEVREAPEPAEVPE